MSAVVGHGTHGELFASVNASCLDYRKQQTDMAHTHTHRVSRSCGDCSSSSLGYSLEHKAPSLFFGGFFCFFVFRLFPFRWWASRSRESPPTVWSKLETSKKSKKKNRDRIAPDWASWRGAHAETVRTLGCGCTIHIQSSSHQLPSFPIFLYTKSP